MNFINHLSYANSIETLRTIEIISDLLHRLGLSSEFDRNTIHQMVFYKQLTILFGEQRHSDPFGLIIKNERI